VDDFLFVGQGTGAGAILHVLNAPSPAATAALPIGREILSRLAPPVRGKGRQDSDIRARPGSGAA
jgi:L-2-hydroxyglutarate oxidase